MSCVTKGVSVRWIFVVNHCDLNAEATVHARPAGRGPSRTLADPNSPWRTPAPRLAAPRRDGARPRARAYRPRARPAVEITVERRARTIQRYTMNVTAGHRARADIRPGERRRSESRKALKARNMPPRPRAMPRARRPRPGHGAVSRSAGAPRAGGGPPPPRSGTAVHRPYSSVCTLRSRLRTARHDAAHCGRVLVASAWYPVGLITRGPGAGRGRDPVALRTVPELMNYRCTPLHSPLWSTVCDALSVCAPARSCAASGRTQRVRYTRQPLGEAAREGRERIHTR